MKIEIPTECPSCKSTLERVKDQLFCNNEACSAVANKKLLGFIKTMKIKGLGEKTVEKLGLVDIHDIYTIDREAAVFIIGEKLTDKLLAEIDKSRTTKIATFLSAFSIPLIGSSASSKIKTNDIASLDYDTLRKFGLGDKAAYNLSEWVSNTYQEYEDLPITFEEPEVEVEFKTNYSVCITGKIPGYTKNTMTAELHNLGVKVVGSVTKSTTHLICGERKGSAKENKAEAMNIPILTYDNFKEIINV